MQLRTFDDESLLADILKKFGSTALRVRMQILARPHEVAKLKRAGLWRTEFMRGVRVSRLVKRPVAFGCATSAEMRELHESAAARMSKLRMDLNVLDHFGVERAHNV